MKRFGALSVWLNCISESRASGQWYQFIPQLLSIPCFEASHFFFKLAYSFNQIRLRRLCNEEFFLQFYDRRVSTGGVVNILQSLREIERGLKGAEASKSFPYHVIRS